MVLPAMPRLLSVWLALALLPAFGNEALGLSAEARAALRRKEYATLAKLLDRDARGGDIEAQTLLTSMYRRGKGVAKDLRAAAMYNAMAARQYHGPSMLNAALYCAYGEGVDEDPVESAKWFNLWSLVRAGGPEYTTREKEILFALHKKLTTEDNRRAGKLVERLLKDPEEAAKIRAAKDRYKALREKAAAGQSP